MVTPFKFRAKEIKTGEWVEGDLHMSCRVPHIHVDLTHKYAIDTDTICVFFGLKDKNKKEIYDGDIVDCWSQGVHLKNGVVKYSPGTCRFFLHSNKDPFIWNFSGNDGCDDGITVVGNIYDNPELVNKED